MAKPCFSKSTILALILGITGLWAPLFAQNPPQILTFSPARYSLQNSSTVGISVQFSRAMDASTIVSQNFLVFGEKTGFHAGTLTYNAGNQTASFATTAPYQAGERVTVVLTTDIKAQDGVPLAASFQWSFFIRSAPSTAVFELDQAYPAGDGPHFIGAGNFNGDANLDLAMAHSRSHNVLSYLNTGDGTLSQNDVITVGTRPRALAIGDWDSDGDLDIATANEVSNSVSILLNNGSGDFTATAAALTVGTEPVHIAAGDFNGDGLLDLAVTNFLSNSLSVLLNSGGGNFASEVQHPVGQGPEAAMVADLNNDGLVDIAATNNTDNTISLLINNGSGGFDPAQNFSVGQGPKAIMGHDFNKDGRIDLAVGNRTDNTVGIYFNTGGTFTLSDDYPVGTDPFAIAVGDWDGDSDADFVVTNVLSNDMHVLLNTGSGIFQVDSVYTTGTQPRGLDAGDFNGDGIVDLGVGNFDIDNLQIFFNNAGGGANTPPGSPSLLAPAELAAFNPNLAPIPLNWSVPADADNDDLHFKIEIAATSNFNSPLFIIDSRDNVTGFSPAPPVVPGSGAVTYNFSESIQEGIYFWRVTASDGLVFGSPSPARRFTIDSTVPNIDGVVITNPAFAPNWYNPTAAATINFGAQYDEPRAQRAVFNLGALGGTQINQNIPSGQNQTVQATVTLTGAADGAYPLTATIVDSAGNQAGTNSTIRLDSTPPTGARASSPALTSDEDFLVSWGGTGSDGSGSGLSGRFTVRVRINGGAWEAWLTDFQGTSAVYSGFNGNTYGFEAAAHDNVGNVEAFTNTAEAVTIVDTSNDVVAPGPPPTLTASGASPSPWQNTPNFQIQWQQPADPSGIDQAFYKLGNAPTANDDTTGSVTGATSVQITATQENGQNFYIWFSDRRGNVNFQNHGIVILRYDKTPPTGTTASSPTTSSAENFTVSWGGGSDGAGSGLSGFYDIRVSVNGGPFTNWRTNFQSTSAVFPGEHGNTYRFEVAARDVAGNIELFQGIAESTTQVDTTATDVEPPDPPVTLTAAGSNPSPWQKTPQFVINWQAPSDPSGIARALYKLGNPPTANFDTTGSVRSGSAITLNATQEDGQNFYLWFQDQRGNVNFQNHGVVQLRYDATLPDILGIELLNPDFDVNWYNQQATGSAIAEINFDENHLRKIRVQSTGLNTDFELQSVPSGQDIFFQVNINLDGQPDGLFDLEFTLTDSAGNAESQSIAIALDGTPPSGARANSPDTSGIASFLVSWGNTGSDGGSGLSGVYDVQVQANGGAWQPWLTNFIGTSSVFDGANNNVYAFEVAAYDNVGNREPFNNSPESVTVVDPNFRDSTAPAIFHTPQLVIDEGQSATIAAQVTDNIQISEVLLFFKPSGAVAFQSLPMNNVGGDNFQLTLSPQQITKFGINYFIRATDGFNFSFHPAVNTETVPNNLSVRLAGTNSAGLVKDDPQPGGDAAFLYRMISVPLNLQNGDPVAVLEDDLGEYNPKQWRLFQYTSSSDSYVEFPNINDFSPGKAFWLIVRESNKFIDSGIGSTVVTNQPFTITLAQGWNDIALPFPFAVDASDIVVPSQVSGPYTFDEQWLLPNQVTVLLPWEGYSFFSESAGTVISILPIASQVQGSPALSKSAFDSDWQIRIAATCGGLKDGNNYIGASTSARQDWDRLDYLEPPYIAEHVSVRFPHEDWSSFKTAFTTDFRPLFADGQIWHFEVESNVANEPVRLTFEEIASLPLEFRVILFDNATLEQRDLREHSEYLFTLEQNYFKREFDLVIGTSQFVENAEPLNEAIPQAFYLSQNYPNPFNAGTTLSYRIAEPSQVKINVLNILGQEVRELVSQQQVPGVYRVHWDGKSSAGLEISSGIYLIRLEAGKFQQIRKVVLVR